MHHHLTSAREAGEDMVASRRRRRHGQHAQCHSFEQPLETVEWCEQLRHNRNVGDAGMQKF